MEKNQVTKTISVQEVAEILGLGRSAAYTLVNTAVDNPDTAPFKVVRLGGSIRISRKSFEEFLEKNGM